MALSETKVIKISEFQLHLLYIMYLQSVSRYGDKHMLFSAPNAHCTTLLYMFLYFVTDKGPKTPRGIPVPFAMWEVLEGVGSYLYFEPLLLIVFCWNCIVYCEYDNKVCLNLNVIYNQNFEFMISVIVSMK